MKPFDVLTAGMLTAAVALASDAVLAEPPRKPNIVVIMTDDVGWGNLGSYGGGAMRGAATPNLDRLATEGMRFVNYYDQASCNRRPRLVHHRSHSYQDFALSCACPGRSERPDQRDAHRRATSEAGGL